MKRTERRGSPPSVSAAQLGRHNALVQQNWDQLNANAQRNADLSQAAGAMKPPSFTAPPLAPASFAPPPRNFAAPLPGPRPLPAFASQPLAGGFTPPPPTTPALTLPSAAGGPAPAAPRLTDPPPPKPPAPSTPFALTPDALASPVTRPDIPAPTAEVDPFAPVGQGGLGLTPPGAPGLTAFGLGGPTPAPGAEAGLGPGTRGTLAPPISAGTTGVTPPIPDPDTGLPPWAPFAGQPLAPADTLPSGPAAPPPAEQPSYLAGLIDAGSRGRALSFLWDRYQQAVQARDGAALPSLSSVVNGTLNGSKEEAQATIDGLATNLDWFGKIANGTASLTDPETGAISDEAIRRSLDLAGFGISGGLAGVEARAGQTVLGAGPIRSTAQSVGGLKSLGPGWRVFAPAGEGATVGALPQGYRTVSRWVGPEEAAAWMSERGTGIPTISGSNRMYVTEVGAAKPGGTGPIRVDFAVPEGALQGAGKPSWFQIFQPSSSRPVYNIQIHAPDSINIPGNRQ